MTSICMSFILIPNECWPPFDCWPQLSQLSLNYQLMILYWIDVRIQITSIIYSLIIMIWLFAHYYFHYFSITYTQIITNLGVLKNIVIDIVYCLYVITERCPLSPSPLLKLYFHLKNMCLNLSYWPNPIEIQLNFNYYRDFCGLIQFYWMELWLKIFTENPKK